MIVVFRMEVSDTERSVVSLRSHPKALKRLATGAEMKTLLADLWDANIVGQESEVGQLVTDLPSDGVPLVFAEEVPEPVFTEAGIKLKAPVVEEPASGITPLRKLIHHVNCAMFSLGSARRMSANHASTVTDQLDSLVNRVEFVRDDLATIHDEDTDECCVVDEPYQ